MKAEILALLRERADYVSGQELCRHFGVSRTAVWKAIGQLKKQGYEIEAIQNRGYRLIADAEIYGQNELRSRLDTAWVGKPLYFHEEIGSTNTEAKLLAEQGAKSGTLVVADMQTAGKGRRGRKWVSPAGTNIYYTLLLKPQFAPEKASMLTVVMALAVAEGLRKTLPLEVAEKVGIKWPNDIVVEGKKVCGILTEMSAEQDYIQYVVIGVGINVFRQEFAEELVEKATDLETVCGQRPSRSTLLVAIMSAFEELYESFQKEESLKGVKDRYQRLLVNIGREVCVLDPKGEYRASCEGITDSGELIVRLPEGEQRIVYAGEVSVRGIYGYV